MQPYSITLVLSALAAVVVVLTRVRLGRDEGAGRLSIPPALLNTHTAAGVPAVILWAIYLVTDEGVLGWLGLLFWWVTVVAGLLILARWMPAKGRHSSAPEGGHLG